MILLATAGCAEDASPSVQARTDGPMVIPFDHGWSTTMEPGEVFTDGYEILHLTGDQPATVTDVRLVGADGLRLVSAKIAGEAKMWPPWIYSK